jgi:hypothetical protein
MKPLTVDELYEYHVKKIVSEVCEGKISRFDNGDQLESFLADHRRDLAEAVLNDITEYFGWDEVLKMIQEAK